VPLPSATSKKKTIALGAAASGDPSTVLPGEATG